MSLTLDFTNNSTAVFANDDSLQISENPATPQNDTERRLCELLTAMRAGDRDAAAAFIHENQPMLLRRIDRHMPARCRRLYDADDILSTLSRRLDSLVGRGHLRAHSPAEFWGLVHLIIDRVLIDASRRAERTQRIDSEASVARSEEAAVFPGARGACHREEPRVDVDKLITSLGRESDRELLRLWLRDIPLHVAADHFQVTPACLRQRWQQLRHRLRERLAAG